ncbi:hypothetical protein C0995_015835 [Termitomyces sp. Mi166|nr:hypothetical protein C0995_015835 [Termitomyces sp. Mi166\
MTVTVKWGKERISFDLPAPDTPLYAVRRSLADYTHLPLHSFKLVHAGAVMQDDNAPISAYLLTTNSTIALIGGTDSPSKHLPPVSPSERSLLATIQSELNSVHSSLKPSLEAFFLAPTNQKEHARLAELLLQSLLRLDGLTPEASWEQARKERKQAVRDVQDMLHRLDNASSTRPV